MQLLQTLRHRRGHILLSHPPAAGQAVWQNWVWTCAKHTCLILRKRLRYFDDWAVFGSNCLWALSLNHCYSCRWETYRTNGWNWSECTLFSTNVEKTKFYQPVVHNMPVNPTWPITSRTARLWTSQCTEKLKTRYKQACRAINKTLLYKSYKRCKKKATLCTDLAQNVYQPGAFIFRSGHHKCFTHIFGHH